MAESASDWGFVKLLIGLDTGVAGALIYGQEHILRVQSSRWLLAVSVLLLIVSLILSLMCAYNLVTIDSFREENDRIRRVNLGARLQPDEHRYLVGKIGEFVPMLRFAIVFFGAGVFVAFCFFLWNLPFWLTKT
jgi:hypothetical protein